MPNSFRAGPFDHVTESIHWLTNAFSKKIENHAAAVALLFMYYNFARVHKNVALLSCAGRWYEHALVGDQGHRGDDRGPGKIKLNTPPRNAANRQNFYVVVARRATIGSTLDARRAGM